MSKRPTPTLEEMKQMLRDAGYEVTRKALYVKHTFQVEQSIYNEFMRLVGIKGVRIKDAVTEALMAWIENSRLN